jgi:hypothetical protein
MIKKLLIIRYLCLYSKEEGTKLKRKTNHQKGREKEKHTRMGQRSSIIIRKCMGLVGCHLPIMGVHAWWSQWRVHFGGLLRRRNLIFSKK